MLQISSFQGAPNRPPNPIPDKIPHPLASLDANITYFHVALCASTCDVLLCLLLQYSIHPAPKGILSYQTLPTSYYHLEIIKNAQPYKHIKPYNAPSIEVTLLFWSPKRSLLTGILGHALFALKN